MIKISYSEPEPTETPDQIAHANIIMCDKFKKGDYLEMSCLSWLKNDSNRDYQDLEQLLRFLNVDAHIIAQPILRTSIPENLEINYPNGKVIETSKPLEYVAKISSKPKIDALNELLSIHSSYEKNFECLQKTGCFMVKKTTKKQEVEQSLSETKGVDEVKKVLACELKLIFSFYKPTESISFIIEDLTRKYNKVPEQIACGEINGNKVYGLKIDGQIASPIGWIEKKNTNFFSSNSNNNNSKEHELEQELKHELEYELIDFRTIKIERT